MGAGSSTFRSDLDPTLGAVPIIDDAAALLKSIADDWHGSAAPDLVRTIERYPQLLFQRSLLLELAIEEFHSVRQKHSGANLCDHCSRFRRFGSSIERSILRQLEAQQYIDEHPELLELLQSPQWPSVGKTFVDFAVCEELGRGSTARAYLCTQPSIGNRAVVLKATPYCGFEASILGRLRHPNIVPIYSTGLAEEHGLQYLCMPYLGRSTLADLIDMAFGTGAPKDGEIVSAAAQRWLSVKECEISAPSAQSSQLGMKTSYVDAVLDIGIQLAEALQYAHEQGILHGDLKPSNVLLSFTAGPLLLDFNLSQDRNDTRIFCGGTLQYMPPEHLCQVMSLRASHDSAPPYDPRADVYSLGVLLYELLAGVTPVTHHRSINRPAAAANALLQQLRRGIPPIPRYNEDVGRELDLLVRRCLSFDPNDRPASMAEVGAGLRRELGMIRRMRRQISQRKPLTAVVCGVVACVCLIAGASFTLQRPSYESDYLQGRVLLEEGNPEKAIDLFNLALSERPALRQALFDRGRARIARGEHDLAISDFEQLFVNERDPKSMAYIGYCFNMKQIPAPAIAWYEKALEYDSGSPAVFNNLGASYIVARGKRTKHEQFRLAEYYLNEALKQLGSSIVVRLNLVRLELQKSQELPFYDPASAWQNAKILMDEDPDDPRLLSVVAQWYASVLNYESTQVSSDRELSEEEEEARQRFLQLVTYVRPAGAPTLSTGKTAFPRRFQSSSSRTSHRRFYLEPVTSDSAQGG